MSFVKFQAFCSSFALQWRHNGRDSVSNHQPHDCFLKRLFRHRSKKTSKLRVTGLCAGKSPEAGEFPAQMASDAENVSIWWHHGRTDEDKWQSPSYIEYSELNSIMAESVNWLRVPMSANVFHLAILFSYQLVTCVCKIDTHQFNVRMDFSPRVYTGVISPITEQTTQTAISLPIDDRAHLSSCQ